MFLSKRSAPELVELDSRSWINSKPLKLESLKGKVVLLDFWAYSCINCVRTFPALKAMWNKYKNKRFVIIGIHTPEFEFEKELGNVKYAVKKHGLEYPVVSDPSGVNWERYGNKYWPRVALIDSEGKLIAEHVGESGYDELETKIIQELQKLNELDSSTLPNKEEKRRINSEMSKETYAGKIRSTGIPGMVCTKETCDEYVDNGNYQKDVINLQGDWRQTKQYVVFLGNSGWSAYKFYASELNVVMSGVGSAEVLLDGGPLTKNNAGKDVELRDGKSYVKIEGADMYNILKSSNYISGVLKIIPFEEMRVYSFTFG